ncbi:MAG: hypothetical protein MUF00_08700 [Gemmatimonadaceae bacterium]|jgi:hypothetical protein|nr:hypothetical protein [Gemmatimonadaceae bacterium]
MSRVLPFPAPPITTVVTSLVHGPTRAEMLCEGRRVACTLADLCDANAITPALARRIMRRLIAGYWYGADAEARRLAMGELAQQLRLRTIQRDARGAA